ncbi:MAG: hypothetical protein H6741_35535 [Alphaproteobacteria bacterium]|nr:hypothetical protein [Alphaproteobacteria bacterium]
MSTLRFTLPLLAFTLLAACGEKEDHDSSAVDSGATDDSGAADDSGSTSIDCATDAWADQTAETQSAWMTACVLPPMRESFQAFDAEEFANFSCATCHRGANTGDYHMPSQERLDYGQSSEWEPGYFNGDGSGLMEQTFVQMAEILGYEPYGPGNQQGFGCAGCHVP